MTPLGLIRSLCLPGLLTGAIVSATGCGGTTQTGSAGTGQVAVPGDPCALVDAQAKSIDGCNTCTCANGTWACTARACATGDSGAAACAPGAQRSAGDGCNTCTCNATSEWICTRSVCTACTDGQTKTEACNTCNCSSGQWTCTHQTCLSPPPPPACKDGDTQMQSCNTCSCASGQWGCTKMACPPPACTDGTSKFDGCNTCSCSGGQWLCTLKACIGTDAGPAKDGGVVKDAALPPKGCGARLGNTCSASEYCAYAVGQMCGAADASATCQPRPQICTSIYAPVCGCDGKTYASDCTAASSGTGVNHTGPCP